MCTCIAWKGHPEITYIVSGGTVKLHSLTFSLHEYQVCHFYARQQELL